MPPLPADLERLLHDLRGPLNAILMHLQVVRRTVGEVSAAKPSLDTMQAEVDRLSRMLTAAFDVLAVERGAGERASLRALVEQALAESEPPGPVCVAAGEWPDVEGDPTLLKHAIWAAVDRALAATRDAGEPRPPEVSVESSEETVTLVVRDWAPRPRSTDPRVALRLSPTSSARDLVGADRIARLHGGALRLAAAEPGGEVRLVLPSVSSPGRGGRGGPSRST
jgi:signal transduction histidine kinase